MFMFNSFCWVRAESNLLVKSEIAVKSSGTVTNKYTYEGMGVEVGEFKLDIRYIEHVPPTKYKNFKPLTGNVPGWVVPWQLMEEYYKHSYTDIVSSSTKEMLEFSGIDEESFLLSKESRLNAGDNIPSFEYKSVLSEMYITLETREFVVVKMDRFAWVGSWDECSAVCVNVFEKINGEWKNQVDTVLGFYDAIPSRSELKKILGKESE